VSSPTEADDPRRLAGEHNSEMHEAASLAHSHPEHRCFRIGEIAEAGALPTLKIFRLYSVEIPTDQTRQGAVGIDDDERPATGKKVAPDRPSEARYVGHVAAIDELGARYHGLGNAWSEHKWICPLVGYAPEAEAAKRGMTDEQVALEGLVRCSGLLAGRD